MQSYQHYNLSNTVKLAFTTCLTASFDNKRFSRVIFSNSELSGNHVKPSLLTAKV